MPAAQEGTLEEGLPFLSFGQGPPLVEFPGIGMTNSNPTGIQRWGEVRLLSPPGRAFTVYRVGRRVGLKPKATVADLARGKAGRQEGSVRRGGPQLHAPEDSPRPE